MLNAHYRSPVDYSDEAISLATQGLTRLYTALRGLNIIETKSTVPAEFSAAMDDDFNTPIAFSVMFDMAHQINKLREDNKMTEASHIAAQLKQCGSIFGILQNDPETFLRGSMDSDFSAKVEKLIYDRNVARQNKNFAEADRIRDELQKLRITIEDGANGTTWRKLS